MPTLSVIIPCYNEQSTLKECLHRVLAIADDELQLQIIIVDDASHDASVSIAKEMMAEHSNIQLLQHEKNQGKGAALNTGIRHASGDFVAIQDADLEYNPQELKQLMRPLQRDEADVVLGSRYRSAAERRVLYFWHSLGNKFLTFLSNMFTDLDLTDMETCYKLFKLDVIKKIQIKEKRFGVEPELVAKIAELNCRVYEMGISYHGRTYAEGKKIKMKDGFRALYCIYHYNAHRLPTPIQLLVYFFIGGFSAVTNILLFTMFYHGDLSVTNAAAISYVLSAMVNYYLCIHFLFTRRKFRTARAELAMYLMVVLVVGVIDVAFTNWMHSILGAPVLAKTLACFVGFLFNFAGRKYLVFANRRKPVVVGRAAEPQV